MVAELRLSSELDPLPATRGDCPAERPCVHVRCRHHLAVDIDEDGRLVAAHRRGDPARRFSGSVVDALWTMDTTCSLDVAASGPHTLDEVGAYLRDPPLTKERVRKIEVAALQKLLVLLEGMGIDGTILAGLHGRQ
ncbi:MAG: hypothetical protein ABIL09_11020 [Gemmatimonadota bacterium]